MSVKDDFLFIGKFEGFAALKVLILARDRFGALAQSIGVSSKEVHQDSLGHIISIMACEESISF